MSSEYTPGVRLKDHAVEVAKAASNFRDLFAMPVQTVVKSKDVIKVNAEDTLDAAFKVLIEKRILSAPVWSKKKRRFQGMVDVTDFVSFIVNHFSADILREDDVAGFLSAKDRFTTILVRDVFNETDHDPWYPVEDDAPLRKIFETFCRGNLHRIPIMDDSGELYSLASQSDAVAFLALQLESPHFASLANASLKEHRIGTWGHLHSVRTSDPALDAFKMIHLKRVTGVAVLDADGKLVSNISASDLRLIEHHGASLSVLFKSCGEFVDLAHADKAAGDSKGHGKIIHVPETASFAEAVRTLDGGHVHRIFVTNAAGEPVAVVSQYDVIKAVRDRLQ